ncbi:unnamed protein product, partial [Didymodactylos carnosus]
RLNQSRLLNVIKDRVVNTIVKRIGKNPWTIILDSTQDTSKKEAVVILVRYLETDDEGRVFPVERIINASSLTRTTSQELLNRVENLVNKLQLDYSKLVGQAYDGANNMFGGITGLQTRLQAKAPHALYVWCHAHRLNLVSTQAMSCTTEMKNCIGVLGELHSFFSGHVRYGVLLGEQRQKGNNSYCLSLSSPMVDLKRFLIIFNLLNSRSLLATVTGKVRK